MFTGSVSYMLTFDVAGVSPYSHEVVIARKSFLVTGVVQCAVDTVTDCVTWTEVDVVAVLRV